MHLVLEIDGQAHELWLVRSEGKVSVEVGGRTFEFIVDAKGRSAEVRHGAASHAVEVEGPERARLDGRPVAFRVPFFAPGGAPGQHEAEDRGQAKVRPPMPGRIVRVKVREGDEVRKGQVLLVLESMKMQNEVAAPHGGRVAKVHVREGQVVEPSAVLLELEG